MQLSAVLTPQRTADLGTQPGPSGTTPSVQSEELTQFLSLLTAQVRNQDPLEPLDSTAFVEQLATFSALEQQVQTNNHLADILSLLAAD